MKFFQFLPLVVPYHSVLAVPLPYTSRSTVVTAKTYIPLIVISISLFVLVVVFFAIKLAYMKYRRIGTIHALPDIVHSNSNLSSSTPSVGSGDKQGRHRGLLVGCLGSPAWETNLTSKLGGTTGRKSSFAYRLHMRFKSKNSSAGSRLTNSTVFASYASDARQPLSSGSSRVPPSHGGSSSKALCLAQQHTSTNCPPRYGDFGELHGVRSPAGVVLDVARRVSPSSIRLVDGPSHSNQVEYAFLSALPPNAIVASPLMGTRDSFQLSRCSLKCDRKPVPPMPSLPLFLPFYLPNDPEALESHALRAREYLPPLRFSPLTSVAKVFHSQHQALEKKAPSSRGTDFDEDRNVAPCFESASSSKTQHACNARSPAIPLVAQEVPTLCTIETRSNHKSSQSCRGLAIGTSQRTTLVTDEAVLRREDKRWETESVQTGVLRTPGSSCDGRVVSRPLKSCLRPNSVVSIPLVCSPRSTLTLISETSTQRFGTGRSAGEASLRTPFSDVDIGILGLDRFRWNDEIKELKMQSCHAKKDSVAMVPLWE